MIGRAAANLVRLFQEGGCLPPPQLSTHTGMLHGGKRGSFRREILYASRFVTFLLVHAKTPIHSSSSTASGCRSKRVPLHHTLLQSNSEKFKNPLVLSPTNYKAEGFQRWRDLDFGGWSGRNPQLSRQIRAHQLRRVTTKIRATLTR